MSRIKGLYAVTPDLSDTGLMLAQAKAALQGGAAIMQYRNKAAVTALQRTQATALLALCREYGIPLIINDHVELAVELDAEGVHIGANDGEITQARTALGPKKIIGVSCYNRIDLARQAKAQGVDYVAFGSCFGSETKPAAVRAPLELFHEAQQLDLPIVAIGGITADNAALAIKAGADAVAVISALWTAPDIRQAAQTFSNLFTQDGPT
jgi:thiamine-phosphate pyrophosphorylase